MELPIEEENQTGEQLKNKAPAQLQPYLFKKGQSGNPSGRPKGAVSLKEYAKQMLASMTEEERQEFMNGLPKVEIWRMAEGNPENKTDLTTQGEKINLDAKTLALAQEYENKLKEEL